MKTLFIAVLTTVSLTGCAGIVNMVPSFWDDNQSASIIHVRQSIEQVTCQPGTQLADAGKILDQLQWFRLYSESKGQRQQDVLEIIKPMEDTVKDWQKRSQAKEGSQAYCQAKKRIMQRQSERAAESVLGRF